MARLGLPRQAYTPRAASRVLGDDMHGATKRLVRLPDMHCLQEAVCTKHQVLGVCWGWSCCWWLGICRLFHTQRT
jgi:hypothetical protein